MNTLHNIPKEYIGPEYFDAEKRGIEYLYSIGYRRFKKVGNRNWTIGTGQGPVLDEIDVEVFQGYDLPHDALQFDSAWIDPYWNPNEPT